VGTAYDTASRNGSIMWVPLMVQVVEIGVLCGYFS